MSHKEKKVKRIVINASNTKKINNDHNKNGNNQSNPNQNFPTHLRLPLSQQQMETSSYRLSRVRNDDFSNRFVENEIKESFCFSFFRDNPDMLDTRPPSVKLFEYYEKLGIPIDTIRAQNKGYQKNGKIKVNSDDIIKFNNDVKYSHSDNFSLISYPFDLPTNFTRKEKIQLLSQMIPLELIVHGKDSFELLRAHIMIAYYYNTTRKPQPAIRHLNEARKIQGKVTDTSNSKNSSKLSPSTISKSSRMSRKTSPSSIKSQKKIISRQHEYNQKESVSSDDFYQNKEIEKEIDDEISIEFSNAYLMLAMNNSTSSSSKSIYIKNAIISLSRFVDQSENNNDNSQHLNDHLILRKDLAYARLLFVQKKYEESAKIYENILFNNTNSSNNENESKTSKNDRNDLYNHQIKNDQKIINEAVKLDELIESADLKIEAAENINMIIKNQFNIIKEKRRKIRSSRDFDDINYEDLIDDIDYALDLYYEARDSYEEAGLDENFEECENIIQKLEKEKEEVYSILDQLQIHQIQEEEEEEEKSGKNKKGQIAENTVEVNFESSSSLDEKENQEELNKNKIEVDLSKSGSKVENSKLDVKSLVTLLGTKGNQNASSTFQGDNEYGSDENEDETNANINQNETNEINKNDETDEINKNDEIGIKNQENDTESSKIVTNIDESNKSLENNSLNQNEGNNKIENDFEDPLNKDDLKNTISNMTNSLINKDDKEKSSEIQQITNDNVDDIFSDN